MKTIDEIKDDVYTNRVKFIEKAVTGAILSRATFVEIPQFYITDDIKSEMNENGYIVKAKDLDPAFVVVSW